jgi:hypothetical protein
MRLASTLVLSCALSVLAVTPSPEAAACGACFHEIQETESTQVTGHRMILSISPEKTTLWDQIRYSGNPSSFAWVLPVKGMIDLGVSSDALFANLELQTAVTVRSPTIDCKPPPLCGMTSTTASTSTTGGGSEGGWNGVTVIAQKVVGPYESVQLSSQDPAALEMWLLGHGYAIPPEVAPILDAYVAEGFDFLALKLVPGGDVQSMRPVRVTTLGAGVTLPLRMVAIGGGATVPISLWVLGEGRYQPENFPWFTTPQEKLVWDWDTSSSNYALLAQEGFAATMGHGWLVEAAEPFSKLPITDGLVSLAMSNPLGSGYADDTGEGALLSCAEDLDALFGAIDMSSLWITRLHAELSREALASDLGLAAAQDQSVVKRNFTAQQTSGDAPQCPTYPPCPSDPSTEGSGGASADTGSGCSIDRRDGSSAEVWALILAALGVVTARRWAARSARSRTPRA